jgi:hypothetical protein
MTRLVNEFLTSCLIGTEGWDIAAKQLSIPTEGRLHQAGSPH